MGRGGWEAKEKKTVAEKYKIFGGYFFRFPQKPEGWGIRKTVKAIFGGVYFLFFIFFWRIPIKNTPYYPSVPFVRKKNRFLALSLACLLLSSFLFGFFKVIGRYK